MAANVQTAVKTALLNGDSVAEQFPADSVLEFRSGSRPASVEDAAAGTLLCTITLPATPWGTPSSGSVAKNGTWSGVGDAAAGGGTDIGHARLRNAGDTRRIDYAVTVTGGGGDVTLDNISLAEAQALTMNTFTVSIP